MMIKRKRKKKVMKKNNYKVVSTFNCCGNTMVTVIIKGRAACVMYEFEYRKLIELDRKIGKKNKLRKSA